MKLQGKLAYLAILVLVGCGGPGGDTPTTVEVGSGQFIDSAVEGLEYQSGSIRGLTSSDGSFQYEQGSSIQFFIGDIVLGEGTPADVMSPLDIIGAVSNVTDDHVLNIARFLQTLDTDNDPTNGITISAFMRQMAVGKSIGFSVSAAEFEASGNVQVIVAELTASNVSGPQSLVSAADAEEHLRESLGLEPMPDPPLTLAQLREVCKEPTTTSIASTYGHKGGEVLVKFDVSLSREEVTTLVTSYGLSWSGSFLSMYSSGNWGRINVPVGIELQWIRTFETLCLVLYANPNYIVSIDIGLGDCSIAC